MTDEDTDQHSESFYAIFKQEEKEVQYSNEGFDRVNANFVGIKSLHKNYSLFFLDILTSQILERRLH